MTLNTGLDKLPPEELFRRQCSLRTCHGNVPDWLGVATGPTRPGRGESKKKAKNDIKSTSCGASASHSMIVGAST